MHHTDRIDGVVAHHFASDDEITHAALIFGVGERDETLPTQGVAHVLEHLVMDAVRRTPLEINATVEASTTQFVVSGSPDRVGAYLEALCRVLNDPPVDRLTAEAPVVAAEIGTLNRPEALLLSARYGLRDLGVPSVEGPGPDGLPPEAVTAQAARWFVSGNAVLVLDGPRPGTLRLPLRAGGRPAHDRPEPRRWPAPHAIRVEGPACQLSALLPEPDPNRMDRLAVELIRLRLTEVLRHREGLTYVVEDTLQPSGPQRLELHVRAEPPPRSATRAGHAMIAEMQALLRDGPSAAELLAAQDRLEEMDRGRGARISAVVDHTVSELLDVSSPPPPPAGGHRAVDPTAIADYLQALEPDLLYLVSDDPGLDLVGLGIRETSAEPVRPGPLPAGTEFRPGLVARALNGEARSAVVVLEATGISQQLGPEIRSIRWDAVAGLMEVDDDESVLFGLDGTAIPIGPALYRGGQELLDAARRAVPGQLRYRRSALLDGNDEP